jgi:hypothetical protein
VEKGSRPSIPTQSQALANIEDEFWRRSNRSATSPFLSPATNEQINVKTVEIFQFSEMKEALYIG